VIQDLVAIKNRLLRKHKEYEQPNADEYRNGLLTGLEVALQSIECLWYVHKATSCWCANVSNVVLVHHNVILRCVMMMCALCADVFTDGIHLAIFFIIKERERETADGWSSTMKP